MFRCVGPKLGSESLVSYYGIRRTSRFYCAHPCTDSPLLLRMRSLLWFRSFMCSRYLLRKRYSLEIYTWENNFVDSQVCKIYSL